MPYKKIEYGIIPYMFTFSLTSVIGSTIMVSMRESYFRCNILEAMFLSMTMTRSKGSYSIRLATGFVSMVT